METQNLIEPKKKVGRPPKTQNKLTGSVKDKVVEPVKDKEPPVKKEKKDKAAPDNTKLTDSLKELNRVVTANKKEIDNMHTKIQNIIKKIK